MRISDWSSDVCSSDLDQLIDYTWGRISTLCEEDGTEVLHVDFGEPYTPSLRARVLDAARTAGIALVDGGCYGATQGPRLETRAEIAQIGTASCRERVCTFV